MPMTQNNRLTKVTEATESNLPSAECLDHQPGHQMELNASS
jgi:hypothetical protein